MSTMSTHIATIPSSGTQLFVYNDCEFHLSPDALGGWNLHRLAPGGETSLLAIGLFAGTPPEAALQQARALAHTAWPVGVRSVGPDVAHPLRVGDLRIVGPDVNHPNFIRWERDSSSFPPAAL